MTTLAAGSSAAVALPIGYAIYASGAYGTMQVAPPNPSALIPITPAGATVGPFAIAVTVNLTASGAGITYNVDKDSVQPDFATLAVDPLTGKAAGVYDTDGGVIPLSGQSLRPLTAVGTYTGNGSATGPVVNLGFTPDLIFIKDNASDQGVWHTKVGFYGRSDSMVAASAISGLIQFTPTGFSITNTNAVVNTNAIVYYYFALSDNGSGQVAITGWAGNAINGRTVNVLQGKRIKAAFIKRDWTQAPVHAYLGAASVTHDGNSAATYATINADGTLTLDASANTNEWTGSTAGLGEAMSCTAFLDNADSVYAATYLGTGAAQTIPLPWYPDFLYIQPRNAQATATQFWTSNLAAGQHIGGSGVSTGRITSVSQSNIILAGQAAVNGAGLLYTVVAFRQNGASPKQITNQSLAVKKSVQLNSNGYIDCGTSDTLKISGASTIEFFGSINPSSIAVCPNITPDSTANVQYPLITRGSGADAIYPATPNVSFALEAICAPNGADWPGTSIAVATNSNWAMGPSSGAYILDYYPMTTGYRIDGGGITAAPGPLAHVVATHDGNGWWTVYVNGQPVRERKVNLATEGLGGLSNLAGISGHRTVIGARQRSTIDLAHGLNFRLARVYASQLTAAQVLKNYNSLFENGPTATAGYVEQWSAANASGSVLLASVNPANNGTIVNGQVI